MYQANGTYYTEEHSISFGDLITRTSGGESYVDFNTYANTWEDWHLIPSSRPVVAHPNPIIKYVEIPGSDNFIDLTTYLSGKVNYGQRQGSFSFFVDNYHENYETIRTKMVSLLHGKKLKMCLLDDPGYYYEGRFVVGNWESGADHSSISITYQLDPYKISINNIGSDLTVWDTFNFETDYDYSVLINSITLNNETKTFIIHANDYPFVPTIICTSGSVTATFGGVTKTVSSSQSKELGKASVGSNTLTIHGTGVCKVHWKGGSL